MLLGGVEARRHAALLHAVDQLLFLIPMRSIDMLHATSFTPACRAEPIRSESIGTFF